MGRFLLFVIVVGGIALYFTNPSTDEVRAQLNGQVPAALSAAMPSAPSAPSETPAPAAMPTPPAMPAAPPGAAPSPAPAAAPTDAPAAPPAAVEAPQGEMQLDRKDYYLFSVYKITVGGNQLPGCVIGIAKHAIPYGQC